MNTKFDVEQQSGKHPNPEESQNIGELKKRLQKLELENKELRHQIDMRKKAEEYDELSIASFKQFFNSFSECVFLIDIANGSIIDANKSSISLYGIDSTDEIIGSTVLDLSSNVEPYTAKEAFSYLSKAAAGEDQLFEWQAKKKDGQIFWVEISLKQRIIYGEPCILAIVRDISERKRQEATIREDEELMRRLIENSPVGMHFYELKDNGDLIFTHANAAADQILLLDHTPLFGKTLEEAFPYLVNTDLPDIYKRIARQGGVWRNEDVYYKDKSIEGAFEVLVFQTQERNMVATFSDITSRKVAEHELKLLNSELESRVEERTAELQATLERLNDSNYELTVLNEKITNDSQKILQLNEKLLATQDELKENIEAKNKFFSIVAHDLKGPFTGFVGLTDLLAKDTDELSVREIKKLSKLANNAANAVYKLLEDLLEWSQFQMHNLPFTPALFDVHELAFNTVFTFNDMAVAKNIKLKLLFEQKMEAFGDRNMVVSVLRNLVNNAIKFTDQGGCVEIGICSEPQSNYVCIFVKDNGVGIPEEYLPKMFAIDRDYKTSGTAREIGTGLGLVLCREFIEKNHGKIWVESCEGKGSTFYFTLPSSESSISNSAFSEQ